MTSKKKIIAVDLDDVISINVPAFIQFSNRKWGTDLTIEDYEENWMRTWDVNEKELNHRTKIIKNEFWHNLKHSGEALPVLKRLTGDYKLVIATSRRRDVSKITQAWIEKYFGGIFDEIHHAGIFDGYMRDIDYLKKATKATKAKLCREIGADYLVDDHPKHCIGAHKVGVEALLFGDYPWNRKEKLPKEIARVKNWLEVEEYFAKRS